MCSIKNNSSNNLSLSCALYSAYISNTRYYQRPSNKIGAIVLLPFAMKYYNILNSVSFFLQPSSQVQKAKISPTSDEHVLDQLSQCEVKLLKVLEELDGKELDDVVKEMEDEDVSID